MSILEIIGANDKFSKAKVRTYNAKMIFHVCSIGTVLSSESVHSIGTECGYGLSIGMEYQN